MARSELVSEHNCVYSRTRGGRETHLQCVKAFFFLQAPQCVEANAAAAEELVLAPSKGGWGKVQALCEPSRHGPSLTC